MAKQDDWARVTVRLPPDLHARLLSKAAKGPGSLNAEIIARLERSLEPSDDINSSAIKKAVSDSTAEIFRSLIAEFDEASDEERIDFGKLMVRAMSKMDSGTK